MAEKSLDGNLNEIATLLLLWSRNLELMLPMFPFTTIVMLEREAILIINYELTCFLLHYTVAG